MPFIAGSREPLCRDRPLLGAGAGLQRVKEGKAKGLLELGVALDFKRLFFLLTIIPVIVVFFTIFGVIGGWVGRKTGSPCAIGIGLGLLLAWALGVSFPMFAPG